MCIEILHADPCFTEVLVDKNLPDGDGLNLSEVIMQIIPSCRVILISGEEVEENKLDQVGVCKTLLKPINLAQLSALF